MSSSSCSHDDSDVSNTFDVNVTWGPQRGLFKLTIPATSFQNYIYILAYIQFQNYIYIYSQLSAKAAAATANFDEVIVACHT